MIKSLDMDADFTGKRFFYLSVAFNEVIVYLFMLGQHVAKLVATFVFVVFALILERKKWDFHSKEIFDCILISKNFECLCCKLWSVIVRNCLLLYSSNQ